MVMFALEEEMNMPLEGKEGPIGLVLCPSRELARQVHFIFIYFIYSFLVTFTFVADLVLPSSFTKYFD